MQTRAFVTRIRGSDPPSLWRGTWPRFTDPCTRHPRAIPSMVDDIVDGKGICVRLSLSLSLFRLFFRRLTDTTITVVNYANNYAVGSCLS